MISSVKYLKCYLFFSIKLISILIIKYLFQGIIKIGAVNADEHKSLGQQYEIRGFPTIKIFGMNKNKPRDYNGPRTAQGMVDEIFRELRNQVDAKLGGKKSSSGSGSRSRKEVISFDFLFSALLFQSLFIIKY